MKNKAVILSKGGTARELAAWLKQSCDLLGFLDDAKVDNDVLGSIIDWRRFNSEVSFFSALGSYRSMPRRREILEGIPDARFPSAISKDAICYADYGAPGLIVFPGSVVSTDVTIGCHVFIYHNVVVSHDCQISSYSILSNSVTISGNCRIGENCYIGAGSTVLEGRTIGNNCIIAAGATVIADVPDNSIYIAPNKIVENHYQALLPRKT